MNSMNHQMIRPLIQRRRTMMVMVSLKMMVTVMIMMQPSTLQQPKRHPMISIKTVMEEKSVIKIQMVMVLQQKL